MLSEKRAIYALLVWTMLMNSIHVAGTDACRAWERNTTLRKGTSLFEFPVSRTSLLEQSMYMEVYGHRNNFYGMG